MSTAKRPSRSQPGSRSTAKAVEAMVMQDMLPLSAPAIHSQPAVQPLAWQDRPALIEHLFPAQQVSIEAQTERKANVGQTLTALGSYWKGRKPLVLVRACVLGSLLPATEDSERDLEIFELLMAMDDDAFRLRMKSVSKEDVVRFAPAELRSQILDEEKGWKVRGEEKQRLLREVLLHMSYAERLERRSFRPEELPESAYAGIWDRVNAHIGTKAHSHAELIEQLGILRYGHRPKVADPFCGGGSIPFEAARLGCEVYASDLNPIACMLTWGAFHVIGADETNRIAIAEAQKRIVADVEAEITKLGIEHNRQGNRAKSYLYCLETRCPETGWMIPIAPSWVISTDKKCIAQLCPINSEKRFDIKVVTNVSSDELLRASCGTLRDSVLVYTVEGRERRIPIKTIRGDRRIGQDSINDLRKWEVQDFIPRRGDILQERLFCIQWEDTQTRTTYFRSIQPEDLAKEEIVEEIVKQNLVHWQHQGLIPLMAIATGKETEGPIRTMGWTHWHHLFSARQLLTLAITRKHIVSIQDPTVRASLDIAFARVLDFASKLSFWESGHAKDLPGKAFSNQALKTWFTFAVRASRFLLNSFIFEIKRWAKAGNASVSQQPALQHATTCDIYVTDPPYADAVHYHEITEFFISWLRGAPAPPFGKWIWDSRRPLAIKGTGEDFRHAMVDAYRTMVRWMPSNGLQIVMFTHRDARVWADMAAIFWAAGLRVTAAWYIATETTSDLKKGGYVQGTVILVLRKRLAEASIYKDELSIEIRQEVEQQIKTLTGLSQRVRSHGRSENLFNDADLQMAGYAAALRVLTGYTNIEGTDMTAEALRPRQDGEQTLVHEFISFAAQVANEELIPDGLEPSVWESLNGSERFYLRMLDMEFRGEKKLDNYQNFAKAFRVEKWQPLLASEKPNDARLKSAAEFRRSEFSGSEFGQSLLRAILYALYELQAENQDERDAEDVLSHLRDNASGNQHETQNYYRRRQDILAITKYLSQKLTTLRSDEASAARVLNGLVSNEKLGA